MTIECVSKNSNRYWEQHNWYKDWICNLKSWCASSSLGGTTMSLKHENDRSWWGKQVTSVAVTMMTTETYLVLQVKLCTTVARCWPRGTVWPRPPDTPASIWSGTLSTNVNMDIMEATALTLELLSSRNRTSSSSLILRIVLICFLMKAHSMVQPLYGGCVWCCVLQSGDCGPMVRGWEDGGGLGWACLYTASTHPARHGLMVPLQLRRSASRCLAFLYANDCKLTLSVQPDLWILLISSFSG